MLSAAQAGIASFTATAALQPQPRVCLYLPELQRVPVVVHEGQDLLEVKVLLLALHPQVVEGEMDDVHPAAKGGTGSAAPKDGATTMPCSATATPAPRFSQNPLLEPSQGKQHSPEVYPRECPSPDSIP